MNDSSFYHQHFDYMIVGTGSVVAVMTKTLTDDKDKSVLILEAGEIMIITDRFKILAMPPN